jgi:hypothetical protein
MSVQLHFLHVVPFPPNEDVPRVVAEVREQNPRTDDGRGGWQPSAGNEFEGHCAAVGKRVLGGRRVVCACRWLCVLPLVLCLAVLWRCEHEVGSDGASSCEFGRQE